MIRKLSVKMILCALLSLLLAGGTFVLIRFGGMRIIDKNIYSQETILSQEKDLFRDFVAYANKNAAGDLTDSENIQGFFVDKKDIIIAVYNAGQPFAGTQSATLLYSSLNDPASVYEVLQSEYQDYWFTSPVSVNGDFARAKLIRVMYFPMYSAARILLFTAGAAAFAVFAAVFLLLVSTKTRYLSKLSNQLNVMAGGELNVPINVKGTDEIGLLAENMESMRRSFIERLSEEENMKISQSELLRDMSHDLRTPLTALTGYLEIMGRKIQEEPIKGYVQNALNRAHQIKDMTDELFEYFLVYSKDENINNFQVLDASMCFNQMWDEEASELEEAGFETQSAPSETQIDLKIDVKLIRRVMDNICSNIIKYADRESPVKQKTEIKDGKLVFEVKNRISEKPIDSNSSGIGLKSCKKIASLHGGTFETEAKDGYFISRMTL